MKRFLIVLMLLLFISPVFAKTVQCAKRFDVHTSDGNWVWNEKWIDVTYDIQEMINKGWSVVCITPIIVPYGNSSMTSYVIVVFEREE
jgi:hypothetical protein